MTNQNNISLDNVLKALECCSSSEEGACDNCPYWGIESLCSQFVLEYVIESLKALSGFKEYFDNLYGEGLEVANFHMNGNLEPFDNFYNSAMEEYENGRSGEGY